MWLFRRKQNKEKEGGLIINSEDDTESRPGRATIVQDGRENPDDTTIDLDDQDEKTTTIEGQERKSRRFVDGPTSVAKAVIAIDFGSTHSGFAYATTQRPDRIYLPKRNKSSVVRRKDTSATNVGTPGSFGTSSTTRKTEVRTPGSRVGSTIESSNSKNNSIIMTRKISIVAPPSNFSLNQEMSPTLSVPSVLNPSIIDLENDRSQGSRRKPKTKGKTRVSTRGGVKEVKDVKDMESPQRRKQSLSMTGSNERRRPRKESATKDSDLDTFDESNSEEIGKEPTCALFDRKMVLLRYGYDARDFFLKLLGTDQMLNSFNQTNDVTLTEDYLYFEGSIKMRLWNEKHNLECTTMGGKFTVPLIEIVARILEYIKKEAIRHLLDDCRDELGKDFSADQHILWILTVPAIWSEEDKQFMRRAAFQAKMIKELSSLSLILALEPECAAIAAQAYELPLAVGSKILTLDCGGGTVDICGIEILNTGNSSAISATDEDASPEMGGKLPEHPELTDKVDSEIEMDNNDDHGNDDNTGSNIVIQKSEIPEKFQFRQLLSPVGGNWGSKNIDDTFWKFFKQFLGESYLQEIERSNPAAILDLINQWETLKCLLQTEDLRNTDPKARWYLDLSHFVTESQIKLGSLCKKWNTKYAKSNSLFFVEAKAERRIQDPNFLGLPAPLLKSFFDPVIESITRFVGSLLDKHSVLEDLDGILLVGGFGKCDYLRKSFEEAFSKRIKAPGGVWYTDRSSALVEAGAVLFGLQPSVIRSRLVAMTIGVKATILYKSSLHRGSRRFRENKFYDRLTKKHYIRNVFKPFVTKGQEIDVDLEVIHKFAPRNPDLETVKFELFCFDDDDDDNDIDDGNGGDEMKSPSNDSNNQNESEGNKTTNGTMTRFINEPGCRRLGKIIVDVRKGEMPTFECAMLFGYTELRAIVRNLKTGEETHTLLKYDENEDLS